MSEKQGHFACQKCIKSHLNLSKMKVSLSSLKIYLMTVTQQLFLMLLSLLQFVVSSKENHFLN